MKEGKEKWELKREKKCKKEWKSKKKPFYERRGEGRELGKAERKEGKLMAGEK